jgi:GAF domain-containing protein
MEGSMVARGWRINDGARLRTLREYGIFSIGCEERYDEIAASAAELLNAPVAIINFIERDRQWFKAKHGITVVEPPIQQSICVHCLEEGGSLVIEDLATDWRTRDLPLVTDDPAVRFYAGVPIVLDGQGVGVLAVMDVKPRPEGISADQSRELEARARQISSYIAKRSAELSRMDAR